MKERSLGKPWDHQQKINNNSFHSLVLLSWIYPVVRLLLTFHAPVSKSRKAGFETSSKPLQQTIMMKVKTMKSDGIVALSSTSPASLSSSTPCALSKLKDLTITWVPYLEPLPEGITNLKSLQTLTICFCCSLTSLLEEIGSL